MSDPITINEGPYLTGRACAFQRRMMAHSLQRFYRDQERFVRAGTVLSWH